MGCTCCNGSAAGIYRLWGSFRENAHGSERREPSALSLVDSVQKERIPPPIVCPPSGFQRIPVTRLPRSGRALVHA